MNRRRSGARPKSARRPSHGHRGSGKPPPREQLRGRIAAGIHSVMEALKTRPESISAIWIKRGMELNKGPLRDLGQLLLKNHIEPEYKSGPQLDQYCQSHQGALAALSGGPIFNGIQAGDCYLILDQIEDPHNLGAMLRTAWLIGAAAVFIPDHHSVGLTPTVHKVATGACEHIPVEAVSSIKTLLAELKSEGFVTFGLSDKATQSLYSTKFPESVAFVVGSESDGMRLQTEMACDSLISIDQTVTAASYNASVACAMVLSEWKRQQKTGSQHS